jgi:hypothetical protein
MPATGKILGHVPHATPDEHGILKYTNAQTISVRRAWPGTASSS